MASYSSPGNRLRAERESLGLTMQQLADFATRLNSRISAKTISRVESGQGTFARVTFSRLLLAMNSARTQAGLPPLKESDLFPIIKPGKN